MTIKMKSIFQKITNYSFLTIILVFTVIVIFHEKSYARWKTKNDIDIEHKISNQDIIIASDGTYEIEVEERLKLLKEGGRRRLTKYMKRYAEGVAKIEVIEAKSINNGQEYTVNKTLIEDKPLASQAYGFDQIRQISIPFKKIGIGSEVYLKYKYKSIKVPLKNHFSMLLMGDSSEYINKGAKTTIISSIPLHIKVNDPKKVVKVQNKLGDRQVIEIEVIKSFTDQTIDDVEYGLLNPENKTWISISSETDWSYIGKNIAKRYNEVIDQKLPENFKKIKQEAQKQKTDNDKINVVTSKLQKHLQYLGDWKTIDGMFFPRSLKTIDETQYGDCKDFATATAAILSKAGFVAKVALVNRGYLHEDYSGSLPSISDFNHAMVYVINKEGKEHWIDPTNIVSMSDGIFPDVSNRESLILDNTNPRTKMIPEIKFDHAYSAHDINLSLKDNKIVKSINIKMGGEKAIRHTGLGLYESKESIEDLIIKTLEDINIKKTDRITMIIPELKSRIVNDIKLNLKYNLEYPYINTNYGQAFNIANKKVIYLSEDIPEDSIMDYYLGYPRSLKRTTQLDKKIKNIKNLNFKVESPWVDIERATKNVNNNTHIVDEIIIKKSYITYKERKQKNYKYLKNILDEKYNKAAVVINEGE